MGKPLSVQSLEVIPVLREKDSPHRQRIAEHHLIADPDPCPSGLLTGHDIMAKPTEGLYHRKSEVLVRVEGGHDWSGRLVRVNLSANLLGVSRSIRPCIDQVPGPAKGGLAATAGPQANH